MTKTNDPKEISRDFLSGLDTYLKENWQNLTCAEISEIYFQFFRLLKEFKGNACGFTGLSELIIFRFLFHLLASSFHRREITPDLSEFISNSNENLRIGQSLPVDINRRKYRPDIVIYEADNLIAVIQIKTYPTRGIKEIESELKKLKTIRKKHRKTSALLIIFGELSEEGPIFSRLQQINNANPWFRFLTLRNNQTLLKDVLQELIDLERR